MSVKIAVVSEGVSEGGFVLKCFRNLKTNRDKKLQMHEKIACAKYQMFGGEYSAPPLWKDKSKFIYNYKIMNMFCFSLLLY